jgi:sporulation protein YlmC with PRC-barrel domain
MAGRELDLQLHLMDRQVVDVEGRLVCNVDDLELALDERGRPYVTAILVGPRVLGPRIGGRLGRWIASIAGRLATAAPPRIDFGQVTEIGSAVRIARTRAEVAVAPLEDWVNQYVISRIPGSDHAGE